MRCAARTCTRHVDRPLHARSHTAHLGGAQEAQAGDRTGAWEAPAQPGGALPCPGQPAGRVVPPGHLHRACGRRDAQISGTPRTPPRCLHTGACQDGACTGGMLQHSTD